MIKGILFDLDGTLLDDERFTYISKRKEGKKLGFDVKKEDVLKSLGMSKENSIIYYESLYGKDFPTELLGQYRFLYILDYFKKHGVQYKPYVKAIFKYCKKNNIKMIICTSSTREKVDAYLSIDPFLKGMDEIITGDQIKNGKPSPDIYLKGLEVSSLKKEEVLVIEDSLNGVKAGLNGGFKTIMIPDEVLPSEDTLKSDALIMKSLKDVISYIKEINSGVKC